MFLLNIRSISHLREFYSSEEDRLINIEQIIQIGHVRESWLMNVEHYNPDIITLRDNSKMRCTVLLAHAIPTGGTTGTPPSQV